MPVPNKPCKYCKEDPASHWPFQCRFNPNNKKKSKQKRLPKTSINKSRINSDWSNYRKEWFKRNPPEWDGMYTCYLQTTPFCPKRMPQNETTLDHVKPRRSQAGQFLKYDDSNIKPACYPCNTDKGSKSLGYYLKEVEKRNHNNYA